MYFLFKLPAAVSTDFTALIPILYTHNQHYLLNISLQKISIKITIIIMILRWKLLRAQFICCNDFSREISRIGEPERIQANFSNHRIIGNHHSHWSKECFQVIREFRSASVTRIHCNETIACRLQGNNWSVELELFLAIGSGDLNREDLLSNDRQHFKINSIELIETTPRTTWCQTLEEFLHCLVVETIGAVEYDALSRECLRKIFYGFCFTCSCRSFRSTSVIQVDCTTKCAITSICQWSND